MVWKRLVKLEMLILEVNVDNENSNTGNTVTRCRQRRYKKLIMDNFGDAGNKRDSCDQHWRWITANDMGVTDPG